jgi:flagellar motor switch protein FliG
MYDLNHLSYTYTNTIKITMSNIQARKDDMVSKTYFNIFLLSNIIQLPTVVLKNLFQDGNSHMRVLSYDVKKSYPCR